MRTKVVAVKPRITISSIPLEQIDFDPYNKGGLIVSFDDQQDTRVKLRFITTTAMKLVSRDYAYGENPKYQGMIDTDDNMGTVSEVIPIRWYGHFITPDDETIMDTIYKDQPKLRHFVLNFGEYGLEILAESFEVLTSEPHK
jgi:hypothetical protein